MARRNRSLGRPRPGSSVPAAPSQTITVTVDTIGGGGTGRAAVDVDGARRIVDIPYVLAGETVAARLIRPRGDRFDAELLQVLTPGADRQEPACPHFGSCGGCALQHWPDSAYAAWKAQAVTTALGYRDVVPQQTVPMMRTAPGLRRRADFTLKRTADGAVVGFARRASHAIVDLQACPVLMPALAELVPPLRALIPEVLPRGADAEAVVNWTDTGADILLIPADRLPLDLDSRVALAAFAEATDVARVSWGGRRMAEPVVIRRAPRLRLGPVDVEPPPGAFLQASVPSEAALQACVRAWLGSARRVVDLYAGVGTLSLGLLPQRRLTLVEGDKAAVAAVDAALRKAGLVGVAQAHVRDLARDPVPAEELNAYDAAVFDPPRAGAAAQSAELARSHVPVIVAVSCDPVSFARDARTLIDGGYRLEQLLPIDQFLWSPHVELAALFRR
ncbi:class I SAM-dependent RNA methyltransferase [Reyranella sp. CPCC 100927]|uniref:class I SAM-dependent RNA methyltransferase n=1 Tax=Reyranella sp. CPCC 100927 TaxID=2599616 RepID=UPI0011B794BC|nr:class I SAM-dependent RNA methyltransferase [Reyranella sp. CPCC 100927]TWT10805.1 class I SAM-dependent RNA methyltransferase [Reyranella sp. CPCC 100927]